MTQRYLVVYENGPGNLSGFAPDVPGCASTGHSLEEMRENLREALEFHLEGLALDGQPIPAPVTRLVEVPEDGSAEWLVVKLPVAEAISAQASIPRDKPVNMTEPRATPDVSDVQQTIRRLVAQQAGMDEFKVKLTDRIDEDIGLAGLDVSELLEQIAEKFGTDFSGLVAYWDHYFYPEVVDFHGQIGWALFVALPIFVAALLHKIWPTIFPWTRSGLAFTMLLVVWLPVRRHRKKTHELDQLQITVGQLVETVRAGKWTPPKDIDEQICRLGQKRSTI